MLSDGMMLLGIGLAAYIFALHNIAID